MQAVAERTPLWERAGTPVRTRSIEQAIIDGGLDWTVSTRPVFLEGGVQIPDRVAIVRDTDQATLGIAGKGYQVHQNRQALAFVQDYIDATGAEVRSVWQRENGAKVGATLRLPTPLLIGPTQDRVFKELILSTAHDTSAATGGSTSILREWCKNGATRALFGGHRWGIAHRGNPDARFAGVAAELEAVESRFAEFSVRAGVLASREISEKQLAELLEKALPDNRNRDGHIEKIQSLFRSAPTMENIRGTQWAAVQATSEHFEYGAVREGASTVNTVLSGPAATNTAAVLALLEGGA